MDCLHCIVCRWQTCNVFIECHCCLWKKDSKNEYICLVYESYLIQWHTESKKYKRQSKAILDKQWHLATKSRVQRHLTDETSSRNVSLQLSYIKLQDENRSCSPIYLNVDCETKREQSKIYLTIYKKTFCIHSETIFLRITTFTKKILINKITTHIWPSLSREVAHIPHFWFSFSIIYRSHKIKWVLENGVYACNGQQIQIRMKYATKRLRL